MRQAISDQLRQAILRAPVNRAEISRATGVAQSTLSKFVNGVESMSLPTIDKVAACLGLNLTGPPPSPKPRSKRSK